jgi:hypothetical protein
MWKWDALNPHHEERYPSSTMVEPLLGLKAPQFLAKT